VSRVTFSLYTNISRKDLGDKYYDKQFAHLPTIHLYLYLNTYIS